MSVRKAFPASTSIFKPSGLPQRRVSKQKNHFCSLGQNLCVGSLCLLTSFRFIWRQIWPIAYYSIKWHYAAEEWVLISLLYRHWINLKGTKISSFTCIDMTSCEHLAYSVLKRNWIQVSSNWRHVMSRAILRIWPSFFPGHWQVLWTKVNSLLLKVSKVAHSTISHCYSKKQSFN